MLSKLYSMLSVDINTGELAKSQWERDLLISWAEDQWLNLKKFNLSCSQNIVIQENEFKMLYRWHLTPSKLKVMFHHLDARCWHCKVNNADTLHIWWSCKKLKGFWRQIHIIIQRMLVTELPWSPPVMLLSDLAGIKIGSKKTVIVNMLAAASMLIASKWKTPDIPTITEWLSKVRF